MLKRQEERKKKRDCTKQFEKNREEERITSMNEKKTQRLSYRNLRSLKAWDHNVYTERGEIIREGGGA